MVNRWFFVTGKIPQGAPLPSPPTRRDRSFARNSANDLAAYQTRSFSLLLLQPPPPPLPPLPPVSFEFDKKLFFFFLNGSLRFEANPIFQDRLPLNQILTEFNYQFLAHFLPVLSWRRVQLKWKLMMTRRVGRTFIGYLTLFFFYPLFFLLIIEI